MKRSRRTKGYLYPLGSTGLTLIAMNTISPRNVERALLTDLLAVFTDKHLFMDCQNRRSKGEHGAVASSDLDHDEVALRLSSKVVNGNDGYAQVVRVRVG